MQNQTMEKWSKSRISIGLISTKARNERREGGGEGEGEGGPFNVFSSIKSYMSPRFQINFSHVAPPSQC